MKGKCSNKIIITEIIWQHNVKYNGRSGCQPAGSFLMPQEQPGGTKWLSLTFGWQDLLYGDLLGQQDAMCPARGWYYSLWECGLRGGQVDSWRRPRGQRLGLYHREILCLHQISRREDFLVFGDMTPGRWFPTMSSELFNCCWLR